jgi:hypothetical protein
LGSGGWCGGERTPCAPLCSRRQRSTSAAQLSAARPDRALLAMKQRVTAAEECCSSINPCRLLLRMRQSAASRRAPGVAVRPKCMSAPSVSAGTPQQ